MSQAFFDELPAISLLNLLRLKEEAKLQMHFLTLPKGARRILARLTTHQSLVGTGDTRNRPFGLPFSLLQTLNFRVDSAIFNAIHKDLELGLVRDES